MGLDRLPVAVSETELHAIEAPEAFETAGSFLVAITNHGRDAHVHLGLDDDLAAGLQLTETNVYVERDATREVEVRLDPDADAEYVEGRLRIETGYGAESATVPVSVGQPEQPAVPVDETLGDPSEDAADDEDATTDSGGIAVPTLSLRRGWFPVAALAVVALALAGATALTVEDPVVVAGVVAVLVGVVGAGAIMIRR